MRSDVFYWVLNLSLHGSLVCLVIWLLRLIRRIPRRVIYVLWLAPVLRLTMPFAPSLPWSFAGLLRTLGARAVTVPGYSVKRIAATNTVKGADSYFPITYRTDALRGLFETCALIWIIGAAACLLTGIALYVMTRKELRGAKPLRSGVWVSEKVVSPGLVGIIRSKILVPPGMDGQLLDYVEAHERIHRRRLDNLWRCLALGICCVHWFNPVVWFSLRLFFADMELSCDEAVIRKLAPADRKGYAAALLSVAAGRDLFISAFGGAKLRVRIERVLSYRRLTIGAALAFAALTGAVLAVLAGG